jgi:hypothetical protein
MSSKEDTMGTRGLTKVLHNGDVVVAQYGQWDHYPSGQGVDILMFLREQGNVERLRANTNKCYWVTQELQHQLATRFNTTEEFLAALPSLSRDTGGQVLQVIADATDPVPLVNSDDFKDDELFCEGIYTVDLDNNQFVTEYPPYPVKCYDLDKLPTVQEYTTAFQEEEVNA